MRLEGRAGVVSGDWPWLKVGNGSTHVASRSRQVDPVARARERQRGIALVRRTDREHVRVRGWIRLRVSLVAAVARSRDDEAAGAHRGEDCVLHLRMRLCPAE